MYLLDIGHLRVPSLYCAPWFAFPSPLQHISFLTRWFSLGSIRSEKSMLVLITSPLQPLYLFLLTFFHKCHFFILLCGQHWYQLLSVQQAPWLYCCTCFSGELGVVLLCFPLFFLTRPAPESSGGDLGTDQSREESSAPGTRLWPPHHLKDDPVPWFQISPLKFFWGEAREHSEAIWPGSFQVRLVIPVFVWL